MNQDYNSMLMGGGGRGFKFATEGDSVSGFITNIDQRQMTDIKDGSPQTWPDGNPKMQLVISLETILAEDDNDDGIRRVYCPIPSAMQKAIADAVRKAGRPGIEIGGRLAIQFTHTAEPKTRGFSGQKQYKARYEGAVVSMESDRTDEEDVPF